MMPNRARHEHPRESHARRRRPGRCSARLIAHRASEGRTTFAIPIFCVAKLWRIVTDRRATVRIAPQRALASIDRLVSDGATLHTGPGYWVALKRLLAHGLPEGLGVFDCQIAAMCQEHGIEEIWTFDRAFVPHPSYASSTRSTSRTPDSRIPGRTRGDDGPRVTGAQARVDGRGSTFRPTDDRRQTTRRLPGKRPGRPRSPHR